MSPKTHPIAHPVGYPIRISEAESHRHTDRRTDPDVTHDRDLLQLSDAHAGVQAIDAAGVESR